MSQELEDLKKAAAALYEEHPKLEDANHAQELATTERDDRLDSLTDQIDRLERTETSHNSSLLKFACVTVYWILAACYADEINELLKRSRKSASGPYGGSIRPAQKSRAGRQGAITQLHTKRSRVFETAHQLRESRSAR